MVNLKKENYDKMKKMIHYSLFGVKKVCWWWCVCNIYVCVMWGVKTNGNKIRAYKMEKERKKKKKRKKRKKKRKKRKRKKKKEEEQEGVK